MDLLIEIVGWIGVALVLLAYGLLSAGRVAGDSLAFQWLNIVGATGFILNSGWNGAYPSAAANVAWIGIGLYALTRRTERRNGA